MKNNDHLRLNYHSYDHNIHRMKVGRHIRNSYKQLNKTLVNSQNNM